MSTFGEAQNLTDAALAWYDAGCSLIPIRGDGTKRPAMEWKRAQVERIPRISVKDMMSQGFGIGLVCGEVSGNLEMLELEGRASTSAHLDKILDACIRIGCKEVWDDIVTNGYAEWTPSGGLHLIYRVADHDVPGNMKVARRPATPEELAENPQDKIKVLAETRGEGGYVIVAPTGGTVHPSGDSWTTVAGEIGVIPTITWAQREALIAAVHEALDEMPEELPPPQRPMTLPTSASRGDRPGDDFNIRMTWEQILEPHGWRIHHRTVSETFWTRPGKRRIEGWSATTGLAGVGAEDRLFVFSSSTPFQQEKPYNKFHAYTILEHNGDFSAAARTLSRLGFGSAADNPAALVLSSASPAQPAEVAPFPLPSVGYAQTSEVAWRKDWAQPNVPADAFIHSGHTLKTAGRIFADVYQDTFKYVPEWKKWLFFNGKVWHEDRKDRHENAVAVLLDAAELQARHSESKELHQWAQRMGRQPSPNIARWARFDERIAIETCDLDRNRHLITVDNGVIDLDSLNFQPHHDPRQLLTKSIPVAYDKDAECPQWQSFLDDVIPDPEMQDYVQRAIGHTLMGDAEQRAMFLCHGESGSGKSQFIRTMELMFGDFAETAQPNTFNLASKTATVTNDLNDLRGKRFVSLSELDEGERLNESLIKRLTGGDTAKSRGLYQENRQWRVEFSLWMATNHLPRLNSDDNAMWRRVKPIHFPNIIGERKTEVMRLAEKIVATEAAGIFNWMLDGVRKYMERGLDEPPQITTAVNDYRREVDVVVQFLDAATEEHLVVVDEEATIGSRALHGMFEQWCLRNGIRHPLGERRFSQRLATRFEKTRSAAGMVWRGIGVGGFGMLGTMVLRQ